MRFGWSSQNTSKRLMFLAIFGAVGLVVPYALIYFREPFSPYLNNFIVDVLTVLASTLSAAFATMIWNMYEKTDMPRRIWGNFTFGLWLWVLGEVTWSYLNLTLPNGEVSIGLPDVFWITAYYFLGQALFLQYQVLVLPSRRELAGRSIGMVLFFCLSLALAFGLLTMLDFSSSMVEILINAFYPAGDFTLALAAIWLTRNFQGGALGRPWIGLLVFTCSDLMLAWLQLSGAYAWSLDRGNLLSGIADINYFSAYLVFGLGSFSQWLFLKYGFRLPSKAR